MTIMDDFFYRGVNFKNSKVEKLLESISVKHAIFLKNNGLSRKTWSICAVLCGLLGNERKNLKVFEHNCR